MKKQLEILGSFRYALRRFLRISGKILEPAGLTHDQYEALLALRSLPRERELTIGQLAERLQVKHHSAVELADRLVAKAFIKRIRDGADRRVVRLALTPEGELLLNDMVSKHWTALSEFAPDLINPLRLVRKGGLRAKGPRKP